jgi:hypothetical protein
MLTMVINGVSSYDIAKLKSTVMMKKYELQLLKEMINRIE